MPRKPRGNQLLFNARGTHTMRKDGVRRAQQIVRQRSFTYERIPLACICCGGPRPARSFPICPGCES